VLAAEVVPAVAPAEALHDALEPLVDIRGGAIGSDGEHGEKFLRLDPLLLPAMLSGVERALHVGVWSENFCGALKVGKTEADQRMMRSLYQRGVGYSYDAVKIFMPAGAKRAVRRARAA
jgi:hypothetical protein